MRAIIGVLLSLLAFGQALAQESGTQADHEALRALKAQAVQAVNTKDYALARSLLHEPFMATVITQDSFNDFGSFKAYFESLYTRPLLRMKSISMSAEADELSQIYTGTFALTRGSTKERYELADGRAFDMDGRWTAVSMKNNDGWKIVAVHAGTNFLDNPVLGAIEQSAMYFAIGGLAAGLAIGFVGGRLFTRRRALRA
ncbi:MAG: DUF4440 domain-containing protein [Hyphomicrobiaceae bacterium]